MKINRRAAMMGLLAASVGATTSTSHAQGSFPSKPITVIVDYPPGGPADNMSRAIGQVLGERLGQPVVVLNKPGGASQIAVSSLLQLPADGHSLLLGNNTSMATNEFLMKKLAYSPTRDLAVIAPVFEMPMVLWVPAASPFKSAADLVQASKGRALSYGSVGNGSTVHLLAEELGAVTSANLNHVAYRGSGPGMLDLLAGRLDFMFDGVGAGLQHFRDGALRGLLVATPERVPQLPGVPTAKEVGLPSLRLSAWFGVVARAGTPQSSIDLLSAEIRRAVSLPQVADKFTSLGFRPMNMTPREFEAFIAQDREKLSRIVRRANISLD